MLNIPIVYEDDSEDYKREIDALIRQKTYALSVNKAKISKKYQGKFLEDFKIFNSFYEKLHKMITDYVANFQVVGSDWYIFLGSRGTGKTYTACVIANELLIKNRTARYTSLPVLLSSIKAGYTTKESHAILQELISVDFLIVDELGVTALSEDDYRNLFIVFDERYSNEKATLLISNAQSLDFLGQALTDRLQEVAKVVRFKGDSLRGKDD